MIVFEVNSHRKIKSLHVNFHMVNSIISIIHFLHICATVLPSLKAEQRTVVGSAHRRLAADQLVYHSMGTVFWLDPKTRTLLIVCIASSGPFQYPIRRLVVRSRKVSKPRDLYLELYDRSEIWQAPRQRCCRRACQISKRCDNLNYRSRGIENSRDPTIRRLIGYWNRAPVTDSKTTSSPEDH